VMTGKCECRVISTKPHRSITSAGTGYNEIALGPDVHIEKCAYCREREAAAQEAVEALMDCVSAIALWAHGRGLESYFASAHPAGYKALARCRDSGWKVEG
jgi:hypothetical protein